MRDIPRKSMRAAARGHTIHIYIYIYIYMKFIYMCMHRPILAYLVRPRALAYIFQCWKRSVSVVSCLFNVAQREILV